MMNPENIERKLSLNERFLNREIVELDNEKVEVIDIKSEKEKSEIPVVVAPGWAATPEVLKDNILTLVKEGRRAISINAPHGVETNEEGDFPQAELRKAMAIIETLNKKEIDKVDAIGHSEAGIYVTIAATLYPEKFRNIVLVDPGGMIGEDNIMRLAKGFSNDVIIKQTINSFKDHSRFKPIARAFKEAGKTIIDNPKKSLEQILAISNTQIHGLLKGLKEQGIGISIIHGVDDKAFPMDRVQEIAKKDQLDGFYSVKGTHNEFYLKPKEYTQLAEQALTALESRKKLEDTN